MAKAYSYDFRQKVMQAIELDGMKKAKPASYSTLVATRSTCGFSAKLQPGLCRSSREPARV